MNPKFSVFADRLHPAFERLMACEPISGTERLPRGTPISGVYLFSEAEDHLYVGRTNRLQDRLREHRFGTHNDAPFAFKLARHATGIFKSKGGPTRKELQTHPIFQPEFQAAKARVRAMQFRWVEEADPHTQCLLEIYVSIALEARYNDFENH